MIDTLHMCHMRCPASSSSHETTLPHNDQTLDIKKKKQSLEMF